MGNPDLDIFEKNLNEKLGFSSSFPELENGSRNLLCEKCRSPFFWTNRLGENYCCFCDAPPTAGMVSAWRHVVLDEEGKQTWHKKQEAGSLTERFELADGTAVRAQPGSYGARPNQTLAEWEAGERTRTELFWPTAGEPQAVIAAGKPSMTDARTGVSGSRTPMSSHDTRPAAGDRGNSKLTIEDL